MPGVKTSEITSWIISKGLAGEPEQRLLGDFCERLIASGVPLLRANIGQRTLHPIVDGLEFEWWRGGGAREDEWHREDIGADEDLLRYPFHYMYTAGLSRLRQRLGDERRPLEFPLFDDLRARGATDYFAVATGFGQPGEVGPLSGFSSSWTTDAPGGFNDEDIATIELLLPALALAIKARSTERAASTVLETYLGRDVGHRVLGGEIGRGSAEAIRAVLWYADLEGFTKIADTAAQAELIDLLNAYFGCMVDVVHDHGGQVLKFIGDGLLAIFRLDQDDGASMRALEAVAVVTARVEALNENRAHGRKPTSGFHIALHLGEVLYGNVGGRDRLDFTVVGAAVNEVSRIEDMCRPLGRNVLLSASFAEATRGRTDRVVSLGRYALRGIAAPRELYTVIAADDPGHGAHADRRGVRPPDLADADVGRAGRHEAAL
ncbi:MAG: adenylate/guanylate cyclase domain-containing protein [Alphaproteobacteria bacterium]